MKVHELMTPDVELIDPETSIRDAARKMRDADIGALPVGENDRLIGMVTDRDIAVRGPAEDMSPDSCTVREVMSEGIYYCYQEEDAAHAAEVMAEHRVRRIPVLNRDKRLVGIVAIADLARAGVGLEVIGEVSVPTDSPRD